MSSTARPLEQISRDHKRASRAPHLRKQNQTGADMIDALDNIAGTYHHDGPYDATLAARNRDKRYAPVAAVKHGNMEALRATPREHIQDSLRKHVPLQGTATIPPGMEDMSGRPMNYEEGADLMREPDAPGGAYRRYDHVVSGPAFYPSASYTYHADSPSLGQGSSRASPSTATSTRRRRLHSFSTWVKTSFTAEENDGKSHNEIMLEKAYAAELKASQYKKQQTAAEPVENALDTGQYPEQSANSPPQKYHPDDLKGKGEPSYTIERDLKERKHARDKSVPHRNGSGAGVYEMQPTRHSMQHSTSYSKDGGVAVRNRSYSSGANGAAGPSSPRGVSGDVDVGGSSGKSSKRLSDGLKRRLGSFRTKRNSDS